MSELPSKPTGHTRHTRHTVRPAYKPAGHRRINRLCRAPGLDTYYKVDWSAQGFQPQEIETIDPAVACHEHGTALSRFLPGSWDHLGCQLWDHPARLVGGCLVGSLTRHIRFVDVEVIQHGIQGGQCG